jgi:putative transposase
LELVRYILLNFLRARIVKEFNELDKFPYKGNSVMMGKNKKEWQDTDYILACYDRKSLTARRRYRKCLEKGVGGGRRWDLIGGGLVRSAGGWSVG